MIISFSNNNDSFSNNNDNNKNAFGHWLKDVQNCVEKNNNNQDHVYGAVIMAEQL